MKSIMDVIAFSKAWWVSEREWALNSQAIGEISPQWLLDAWMAADNIKSQLDTVALLHFDRVEMWKCWLMEWSVIA